jgi:hypothetical protein
MVVAVSMVVAVEMTYVCTAVRSWVEPGSPPEIQTRSLRRWSINPCR